MMNNKPGFFSLKKLRSLPIALFFLIQGLNAYAQVASIAPGPWNVNATWGTTPPTSASGTITISHAVTIPNGFSVTADELTIASGGSLTIDAGGTLTLANGAGADLTISGTGQLAVNGTMIGLNGYTSTGTTAANTNVGSGGMYDHQYTTTEGTVPTATWNVNSTLRISGYTTGFASPFTSPSWNQQFGNVTFDCTSLGTALTFNGLLRTIRGNLTVSSTGTPTARTITFATSAFPTITIDGNFSISGTSIVNFSAPATNVTYNIGGGVNGGSFNYSSTSNNIISSTGNTTLNIANNFLMNPASGNLFMSSGSTFTGTMDIKGNMTLTSGTIRELGGKGVFIFSGTGVQTYLRTGASLPATSSAETIDWTVSAGSTLDVGTSIISSGTGSVTTINGTLRLGATDANGALQIGSSPAGNIRTPATGRTYPVAPAAAATIIYNGTNAQVLGAGQPSSTNVNLVINNASGVTQLSSASHTVGDLSVLAGNLSVTNAGANSMVVGGNLSLTGGSLNLGLSSTLTLNGNVTATGGNIVSPSSSSNIVINGTGNLGTFPFPASSISFNNFTLNRTSSGSVTFNNDVTITGNTTLTNGNLVFDNHVLVLVGTFTSGVTNGLSGNSNSTLQITGTGALGTLRFAAAGATVGTLGINRTTGSVVLGSQLTVSSALNLLNGSLDNTVGITIGNGASVVRNANSSLLSNRMTNAGGESYDLTYTGTATPFNTGLELPDPADNEDLNNLTVNAAVNLMQNVTINGTMALEAETFSAGSNIITMNGPAWQDNDGTFDPSTGAVIFASTTSVDGTSTPQLGTIQLTDVASVTFPALNVNISGDIDVIAGGIIQSPGTVILNGSLDQTVSLEGNTLFNINIAKSGGTDVLLTTPMYITGLLDVQSANSDFNSNGNLTIRSLDDNNLGVQNIGIAPLLFGATVSGDVTVERYMSAEGRIWRYISSPVQNVNVSDLMEDFPVTGPFQNPSTGPGLNSTNRSFYYYDESTLSGNLQDGWTGYPDNGADPAASPLVPGLGFSAFIRETAAPTVWDLTGPINWGPMDLVPTFSDSGNPSADGWNLIGNPYPSTIFWGDVGWTKSNISESIFVRDSGAGIDAFQTWDGEIGDPFSGQIALGQAFWVQAIGDNPVLQISENAKSASNGSFLRTSTYDYMQIVLTKDGYVDRAYYRQRKNAVAGRDRYDALKMSNGYFTLAIKSVDNYKMAICAIDKVPCGQVIALDLSFAKNANGTFVKSPTGQYKLYLNQFGLFGANKVELFDKFTNVRKVLQPDEAYVFNITSSSQSYRADRFELSFIENVPVGSLSVSGAAVLCSEPNAIVVVENAQADVEYQAFVNDKPVSLFKAGIGQNLNIEIPTDSLALGTSVISLKATNGCATYDLTNTLTIQKENNYTISSFTSTHVCQQGSVTLDVNGAPANSIYKWYETENASSTIAEGISEYQTPELSKPKTYYVSITNSLGCEGPKIAVQADLVNYDEAVIVSPEENELESNYAEGNTWYLNGEELPEKAQIIDIKESGVYKLEVAVNGCTTSSEISYIVTGVEETTSSRFSVYPNPVSEVLTIRGDIDPSTVKMKNGIGAEVPLHWISTDDKRLSVKDIQSGIYYLSAREGNKIKTIKVLKK